MCLINCKLLVMPLSPGRQVQLSHQLNIFHSLSCRLCCFIDVCFSCHFTVFCTFGFLFPTANVRVTSGPVNVRPNSSQHFFFWFPSFFGKISRFASSLHCDVTHRCRSALHPHTSFLLADRIRLPCTLSHSNSMQWNRTDRLMNNKVHLIFIKRRENSLTSLFFWRTRRRFTRCSQLIDFHSAVRCTIKFV